jgi:hypothetical protein
MKNQITALVAGMALVLSNGAQAQSFFEIEAGIGGSAYQNGPNGRWYQDGFAHQMDLTAPAIEAGFTGDLYQAEHWGVSWHADWAWLGTIHTNALAVPDDANYNKTTDSCVGQCMPLARYVGSGHDQGFLLTLEPHVDYGGWRFGIEGGPYLHRSTWSETVIGWTSPQVSVPRNFVVNNDPKWRLGAVVGASIAYKNFSLAYQYFMNQAPSSDPTPPVWNGTHVLLAKYRANLF